MLARTSAPSLPGWIASVAARSPDKVALELEGTSCTYAELERRSNSVASALARDGVAPEALVGVCMDRSIELVVALLGVVKAGAAYVPLDPTHPRDRLDLIVNDAGCRTVLRSAVGDGGDGAGWVAPAISPRQLAYVIYTSGSTGRPKGVQIEHASLSNFLRSMAREPGMTEQDRLLAVTTVSFDIAALELWLPLCVGATVVIATSEQAADARALMTLIENVRPTVMQATPATWRMLSSAGWAGDRSLRALCGGEALPAPLAAELAPRVACVWNLYGPTETTIWSAARLVTPGESPVVVGGPIDDTQLHVLDGAGSPCADGVDGEVFIGGAGLARGYWARPALTAERFVPDHLSGVAGARLYRTGDLGRRRADGTIEFGGRVDHQVKLRGFRIELGEIEAVLAGHAGVESAVAVVRADRPEHPRLVAYVVLSRPVSSAALRDHLAARLPDYMVPSAIVALDALPLTPNRKVDRAALPRVERESVATAPYRAPVGSVEEAIAASFRDVLGIDIGRDDDFFQLGGDSLAAARIINRLAERFDAPLFVAPLFDHPTVASYARYLADSYGIDGQPGVRGAERASIAFGSRVDETSIVTLRRHLHLLSAEPPPEPDRSPNPRAVFLLAPPRSGTSLLRTMLAGHPGMFAASELRLLSFHDLAERSRVLSGRYRIWRDGSIRTLIELAACTPDAAKQIEAELEARGLTTKQYFGELQRRLGSRLLLDKTTDYALDPQALRKAERDFDRPIYIHLVRHPHATARSFAELRMDQVYVFRDPPPFSPLEIGELFWLISHRNALEFLRDVPQDRQIRVQFEQLVVDPEAAMRAVCERIGLDYCDAMIRPYDAVHTKMVDGVYPESKPMGDERFLTHSAIDAAMADKSEVAEDDDFLAPITWQLAEALGYPLPAHRRRALSFAQQRMWFLHELEPDSTAYSMPLYHRLRGPLDREALRRAIEAIVHRHDVLRTVFPAVDGVPHQRITPPARVELPVEVIRAGPADIDDRLARRVADEASHPFDLAAGPLIRAHLLELGPDDHALLVTLHHIVGDGWSVAVFWRELRALYAAFAAGRPSPLRPLPVQYGEFAAWQREQLSGSAIADQLAYWTGRLQAAPDEIDLPFRRPRAGARRHLEARLAIELDDAVTSRLRELAARHRASLFMALLAGFRALLVRHSGQHDICIGTPIAGRQRGELEQMIGLFVNTLVLRSEVTPELGFADILERERRSALDAYAHQDVPFESVVDALRVERSLERNPLFQVLFVHLNMPREREQVGALVSEPLPRAQVATKFDLSLYVTELPSRIRLTFAYDQDLFARESIEVLAAHLRALLAAVVERPERPIDDISLGPAPAASDVRRPIEHQPCAPVHQSIERQVTADPSAIAIRSRGRDWNRRELWSAAADVAASIVACDLGSGARVAVTGPPSFELIAAMLGTFRAGACLVPLSARLDAAHRQGLLRQAQVRLLIEADPLEPFAVFRPVDPISGHIGEPRRGERTAIGLPAVAASDPAYVYFTSGTTGPQKGVLGTHDGLAHFVTWQAASFAGIAGPVCAQLTHLGFDVFLRDVLFPLTTGKLLTIPDAEVAAMAVEEMMRWMEREQVTAIHTVPSLARAWLNDCPDDVTLRSLRCVFIAGEPLPASLVDRWRARFNGDTEFINLYGPTETTLAKCWYRVSTPAVPGVQPIGQPLPGAQVMILREGARLCATEEPGEIVIRTPYRTRGYLDAGGADARRFAPNPFGDDPRDVVYRTGDRGMVRADGTLAILGRVDDQIKIRGQRVDPSGIAAMLMERPGVAEAAVTAVKVDADDIRLAAYVVPERGAAIASAELEQFLRARVPAYMVPAAFVVVDALPRTASGKLDRRALPAPEWTAARVAYVEPRDPREQAVAEIWGRLLGVDHVGARDDFFALGGNSLLATQAVSRIRNLFGVDLSLRRLFEAPTVAALAREIAGAGPSSALPSIERVSRDRALPLSFAQQRMWFLHQLDPASSAYVILQARRLRGPIDREALRRAIELVVHRHEALRTVFPSAGGVPHLQISAPERVDLPSIDLSDDREREATLSRALAAERATFDVERGPLVRFRLIRLGDDDHVLAVAMHHIVSDGWSMWVFWRELAAAYTALDAGRERELPEPRFAYADYAVWQRRWLSGVELDRQLSYWKHRLAGAPDETLLPTSWPRRSVSRYRAERVELALDPELSARVAALARREGASLFMTLLAAFRAVLSRYTGQTDLVIGTPIAGRHHGDVEELIGLFANTLPLRNEIDPEQTFRELLRQERELALEAYAHQDAPFELVVEAVGVERNLARPPLVQVLFAHENVPRAPDAMGQLTIERMAQGVDAAKFDLSVASRAVAGRIELSFVYDADLFERETIDQLARHVDTLLAAVSADPARVVSAIDLLGSVERAWIVSGANQTARDYALDGLLHDLVAAQTERTPDAIAVEFDGAALTYRELDERANRLAHRLVAFGVGPDVVVGVRMGRCHDMVVSLLAVLKAGGAYLPLDPAEPIDRASFMLADSAARVLVTRGDATDHRFGLAHIDLATASADLEAAPVTAPPCSARADNLAYVIFTSGSTGRPKGVMNTHRAIRNRLLWMQEALELAGDDVVVQKTPFTFDVSVWEFFWPLMTGARLVVARPDGHRDPDYLARLIVASGVTTLHFVPSMLSAFLAVARAEVWTGVRRVICSGEALAPELQDALLAVHSGALINLYGPTEAAVDVSVWRCRRGESTVPIGHPIANTQLYVLDRNLDPVPTRVGGELYIGGVQVARGYAGRPGLTAERFLPDPYAPAPGARMYRTGDLVRQRRDGSLEFLGRADHQVKLRGFRIELGEIEAVLRQSPGVRDAVTVVREVAAGDHRLVAYVAAPADTSVEQMRAHAASRLPPYMVPTAIVIVEALPVMASGKLDRKALPEPVWSPQSEVIEPRTLQEQALAEMWSTLLGVDRVGIRDSFFDLGGHSLLATQLVSRIRDVFGVELPLRRVFEAPTIEQLAAELRRGAGDGGLAAPAIQRVARDGELPLSFAQQRMWFLHQLDPASPAYGIAQARRLRGRVDAEALRQSIEVVVHRHDALRTVFPATDGVPRQQVLAPDRFSLPSIELAAGESGALDRALAAERMRAFDLERGPLVRALLIRVSDDEHVLVVAMHHIVSDGWSMGVFWRELAAAYTALTTGREPQLPGLAVSYADYAAWQRRWLAGARLEQQLGFWIERLSNPPEDLLLPRIGSRPAVRSQRGGRISISLDRDLSARLAELGRREGVTLFMTLMAAFRAVLARYTGQTDLVIGTPIAGRHHGNVEDLIGLFVNTLPLRGQVVVAHTFRDLLRQERELALEAYAHQDAPFELVVDALGVERSLSRPPLVQVLFAHDNVPRAPDAIGTLDVERVHHAAETAKLDLSVFSRTAPGRIELTFVYDADLFERETIEQLAGHLAVLLDAASADPGRRLSELSLLTADERRRVVFEWNDTAHVHDLDGCVHHLIEAQASATPDAVAIEAEGETLTYRAVDARANQLAQALVQLGVGAETVVGVHMERCLDLVPCLLAVAKAGGAYVPLDPSSPAARTELTLADSGASVLIVGPGGAAPAFAGARLDLSADAAWIAAQPSAPPPTTVGPDNLAYVLYTSGSSGRPKGVMVTHRAICNRLLWTQRQYPVAVDDVVVHKTPFTFDLSVWECFGTLLAGARLVVARRDGHGDPAYLAELMQRRGVTTIHFVPSMLRAFLAAAEPGCWRSVRRVYCGGEELTPALRDALAEVASAELVNQYGPTETAVDVSSWRCRPGEPMIPIGHPVDNTRLYVLDENLAPVPPLVAGELHVGGVQVARGYRGQPGLTAERFVPDPFGPPGSRLYRTGDRVRARRDGAIEYLGRLDSQVKLRGFRIELGEIEAALRELPGVRDAVATVREAGAGDRRLVAYITGPADLSPDRLRDDLGGKVPHYMVPAAIVVLDALPLLPSGKLDRNALPEPVWSAGHGSIGPRTPHEEALAEIWTVVLGVDRVGIRDSFFDLGGHSLLATQLVSRIRNVFGVELGVRAVFESPTIEQLAAEIDRAASPAQSPAPAIEPVARDGELPLSFAQQRMWFLHQLEPSSTAFTITNTRLLRGPLDREALRRAIEVIVHRHDALRTVFPATDGVPRQHILGPGRFELPAVDLLGGANASADEVLGSVLSAERGRPFDLARGPLVRALLVAAGGDEHVLAISMHHIVSDGWSMGVFWRELGLAYAALESGRDPALPPLRLGCVDHAVWQRRWLSGEQLDRQLRFWTDRLAGAAEEIALPMKGPRPRMHSRRGARIAVALDRKLTARVVELGRREGATLFMTLLAGFRAVLARYSGQSDLVIGTPIAGRHHDDVEGLIGLFVNTLPLRAEVDRGQGFRELVRKERALALDAYAHQDAPFELIVEALGVERSLNRPPLVQVLFAHQNMPGYADQFGRLAVERMNRGADTAQLDLSVFSRTRDKAVELSFVYNVDLFERETIEQMARHVVVLLEAACAAPDRPVGDLELVGEAEALALIGVSRDAAPERPLATLPERFSAQAAAAPAAIAVVARDASLSYGELDRRSNQLAHHLLRKGIGREDRVALCLDGGAALCVSMLGILKAGAAYVPLDPEHPAERLRDAVADSGARLVITGSQLADRFDSKRCVMVDADAAKIAAEPDHPVGFDPEPEQLAYVIYTSGSTGRPKGVGVSHRSLVNFLCSMQQRPGMSARDVLLAATTISFDISGLELYLPLISGARVVIASRAEARDAYRLQTLLRESEATVFQATPSSWWLLIASGWSGNPALRALCGGEALPAELAAALLPRVGELWNMYGPTETTIWSAADRVEPDRPIALGEAVAATRLYVLESGSLRLAPAGIVGELFIGGAGLARGYVGRPGLTAERFLPDPYASSPGARMYRTGDRVRRRVDGRLEFLGRGDHQIKLRGFRIELGEIEAVLRQVPGVRDAVAVVRELAAGDRRLVVYVAAPPDIPIDQLRAHAASRLPHYMVPTAVVVLEALPLMASGKLDRKALPAPAVDAHSRGGPAPHGDLERAIAAIWCEVLSAKEVSATDNFFDIGGNSMSLVTVHGRLVSQLGIEFPLAEMFQYSTVASLARFLAEQQRSGGAAPPPAPSPELRQRAERRQQHQRRRLLARRGSKPDK